MPKKDHKNLVTHSLYGKWGIKICLVGVLPALFTPWVRGGMLFVLGLFKRCFLLFFFFFFYYQSTIEGSWCCGSVWICWSHSTPHCLGVEGRIKFALLIRMYVEKLTNSFTEEYNSTDAAVYTVYGTEIYVPTETLHIYNVLSLKVLSSENSQGSKLGSNNSYWFSVVVLGIISIFKGTPFLILQKFFCR